MRVAVLATTLFLSFILAGEPGPEASAKPWRPYLEIPELLLYEGFEGRSTAWTQGKLENTVIQAPNSHSWKLGEADWGRGDKWLWAHIELNQTPLKMPSGLEPNNINIQFSLFSEELGEIHVKFHDGDFTAVERVAKVKAWSQYNCKLSDCIKDKNRPKADATFREFCICMKPRDKNKPYPNVYVDDIIVTYGVRPEVVLPRAMQADMRRGNITRTSSKDGFTYTPDGQDALKAMLKTANHHHKIRSVLVVGPRAADSADLAKAMSTAAAKNKMTGYTFVPAAELDGTPSGGLMDGRMLLLHNIQKADAEYVVFALGYGDSNLPGRPADSVRIALQRAIDCGCVPVLCVPSAMPGLPDGDKQKLDGFLNAAGNICAQMMLPFVDTATAVKNVQAPFDGSTRELNTAGLGGLADLAAQAIKHIDANLFGRK